MNSFVHLHVHSCYSILDGMSSIPDLIQRASQLQMPAIALTDHGNMFGIKDFFDQAGKHNSGVNKKIAELKKQLETLGDEEDKQKLSTQIAEEEKKRVKPILGCEVYVAHNTLYNKKGENDRSGWHLILLAKNKKGYQNLCKMLSIAWVEGFYYRARIDKDLLKKHSEGLIVASACLGGEISRKVRAGQLDEAEKAIYWYKELFGEDYYIEIQRHKTDKAGGDREVYKLQQEVNKHLIDLARKTNTKIIATNDVHFVEEEHGEAHDRLICLSTGKDLDDPNRMHYTKQEWLKSPDEMAQIFDDIPEALENTLEIAAKIEDYSINSDPIMPMFSIPEEFGTEDNYRERFPEDVLKEEFGDRYDKLGGYEKAIRIKLEADYLAKLSQAGAERRYGKEDITPEIQERIDFELETMKTMGFPGYFLIVQDFIQAARDMGVSVGPGRGSAAGSVVAYCLGITDIDPLKYDLLFERFLNPDRISMPDIDIDFDDDGRGDVLRWVTEKYGKEKVAHIITYGTMATKSSIKDVARVQKLPLPEVERLTKLIPNKLPKEKDGKAPKVNLKNCIEHIPELRREAEFGDDNVVDTLKYAQMLEGTVRNTGVHACGIIIGSDDLTNFVPLSTAKEKGSTEDILVTQYEGSVIENVGLIKMDFLGLKTLSIIKEALKNIKKSKGIDVDIDKIPLDDAKTYELFCNGNTIGVFQFESIGMQKSLKDLQPSKFEDLIAMNALYRPGPMDYIPSFIRRKNGQEEITYDFPEMEKRLKETYGIAIYQEQVMLMSRDLAGFTRGQSDELRKAMGKKIKSKMDELEVKFIEGATQRGFKPIEKIKKIWEDWSKFAEYAFNKSHATCYSWIAYQTAYLKANYPVEYMAANLTKNLDNIAEVTKFMDDCKSLGINVLGPDVNESALNFTVNKAGEIRFGLGGIKGVGRGAVEAIIIERNKNGEFKDIFNFVERVSLSACNRKTVESLALAGAFDSSGKIQREQFFTINNKDEIVIDALLKYGNKYQADRSMSVNTLFGGDDEIEIMKPSVPYAEKWSPIERLNREKDLIGIYLSAHPLDEFYIEIKNFCNATTNELKALNYPEGTGLKIGGMIVAESTHISKTGNPYGRFTLEDFSGSYDFTVFGKTYTNINNFIKKDWFVVIEGSVKKKWEKKERGQKQPKDTGNQPLEFYVENIRLLSDITQTATKNLTLNMEIGLLDDENVQDLCSVIKDNPGNVNLYLNVKDYGNKELNLFSRRMKIELNKEVKNFMREKEREGFWTYKLS